MKWKTSIIVYALVGFVFSNAWAQGGMQSITDPVKVFETGYLQVVGVSEEGQSRYQALRAAQVVAQRDILEALKGLNLYGTTSVKDGMLSSDEINTTVNGFLHGAVKCGQNFNTAKGFAEVCMRLNIRGKGGLYDIILPLMQRDDMMPEKKQSFNPGNPSLIPQVIPPTPNPSTAQPAPVSPSGAGNPPQHPAPEKESKPEVKAPSELTHPYDGLIVDARDFKFRPALVNRVLAEGDEVIFEPSRIQSNILVERGCGGFTTDDGKARALLESWGSKNPMTIKCTDVKKFTDAKISKDDAAAIYVNDKKSNLLAQARVVFLLK